MASRCSRWSAYVLRVTRDKPRRQASLTAVAHGAGRRRERRVAEGEGFEPPIPFRVQRFSRPPPSTARPSLRSRGALPILADPPSPIRAPADKSEVGTLSRLRALRLLRGSRLSNHRRAVHERAQRVWNHHGTVGLLV